jgi:hypothetical protein
MLNVTRETKATLNGATGRALLWHNDKEPAHISLAVPGDRVKLTPDEARAVAAWLVQTADAISDAERNARVQVMADRYGVRRGF